MTDRKAEFLAAYRERPRRGLTYAGFCREYGTSEGEVAKWMDDDEAFRDEVAAINREKQYTARNIMAFNAQTLVDKAVNYAMGEPKVAHQYQKLLFEMMGFIERGARVNVDARSKKQLNVAAGGDAIEQLLDRVQLLARSFERVATTQRIAADKRPRKADGS